MFSQYVEGVKKLMKHHCAHAHALQGLPFKGHTKANKLIKSFISSLIRNA